MTCERKAIWVVLNAVIEYLSRGHRKVKEKRTGQWAKRELVEDPAARGCPSELEKAGHRFCLDLPEGAKPNTLADSGT